MSLLNFAVISFLGAGGAIYGSALANEAPAPKQHAVDLSGFVLDESGAPQKNLAKMKFKRDENGAFILDEKTQQPVSADPTCSHCPDLTIAEAIVGSMARWARENQLPEDQKWALAYLAGRIRQDPKNVTFSSEEVAVVREVLVHYGLLDDINKFVPLVAPNDSPPKLDPEVFKVKPPEGKK